MTSLFEDIQGTRPIKVTQATTAPSAATLAGIDQLLLIIPEKPTASLWRRLPQGKRLQSLLRRRNPGAVPAIRTRLANKRQTGVILACANPAAEAFDLLSFARRAIAEAGREKAGALGVWVAGFKPAEQARIAEAMTTAAMAAAYVMPAYKEKQAAAPIRSLRLLDLSERIDLERVAAESEGNNIARFLTALPANKLDAPAYCDLLQKMSRAEGWQYKRFGVRELKKLGAGAFLAVAQGNADDSAAIVRLRYRPNARTSNADLALVGKGIIFDTGGTNLKPFASMLDMHIDMGGSAVAVGTLMALSRVNSPLAIDCWLAITENRTGPTAYKSQDVITALNGKTIQTIHTDAEGRMALADALTMACGEKPGMIIDYATLTGACVNAVTTRYSGAFTNRPDLHPVLKKSGRESGERVWPFPIGGEFIEELKSDTADIAQCAPNGGGDHILAATFLNEFVSEKIPWVHVDLSACSRKGGLGAIPSTITGFGVRFSLNLIVDKNVVTTD